MHWLKLLLIIQLCLLVQIEHIQFGTAEAKPPSKRSSHRYSSHPQNKNVSGLKNLVRLPRDTSPGALEKERETCGLDTDALVEKYLSSPKCGRYDSGKEDSFKNSLTFSVFQLVSPVGVYRVRITHKNNKGIKVLAISALSVSRHFFGEFYLGACNDKDGTSHIFSSERCRVDEFPGSMPISDEASKKVSPKLGVVKLNTRITDSGNEKDFASMVIYFKTSREETKVALPPHPNNRFIFTLTLQLWDTANGVGGPCIFNYRSPVYRFGTGSVVSCEERVTDKDKMPELVNDKFELVSSETTTSRSSSTTAQASVSKTTTMKFPFNTVQPLITDPNALLPEFILPTAPGYGSADDATEKKNDKTENLMTAHEIYKGCGKKKGCIGDPPSCIPTRSCSSVVSYGEEDDYVKFELFGRTGKYIAIGLSNDQLMGNDSVVECVREYRTQVNAYRSWNFDFNSRKYYRRNLREDVQQGIKNIRGVYENGNVVCEFWLYYKFEQRGVKFDLSKEDYYVFQVRGSSAGDGLYGNIGYHSEGQGVSKIKYDLHDRFRKTALRIAAERVHGVLMIFAWLFCFPLSTFLSRYYKETFKDRQWGGYTFWYAWHVIVAWIGILATLLAMASSVVGMEPWRRGLEHFQRYSWNFHNKYGVALLALCVVAPVTGYAIKRLNPRYSCQLMNYTHGIVGHVSLWLGVLLVLRTTNLEGGLPCSGKGLVITWIVFYIILHLLMSYMVCYVDFVQGERVSRAYNPILLRTAPHPPFEDVTGSPVRKFFLCIFVSCFTLLTGIITLVFMFGTGCVDDTLE